MIMNKVGSRYHIEQGSNKFYINDQIRVYRPGIDCSYGKVTHVTQNGFYLDVGNKKDKYFNFRNEMELSTWEKGEEE